MAGVTLRVRGLVNERGLEAPHCPHLPPRPDKQFVKPYTGDQILGTEPEVSRTLCPH